MQTEIKVDQDLDPLEYQEAQWPAVLERCTTIEWDSDIFPHVQDASATQRGRLLAFLLLAKYCPVCNTRDSIIDGPKGGAAINVICNRCETRHWMSDPKYGVGVVMGFGAQILAQRKAKLTS